MDGTDFSDIDNFHLLADEILYDGFCIAIDGKGDKFYSNSVLINQSMLIVPAELWISRLQFSDSGILWYHKDFDIKSYLAQEYEEQEADLIYNRIANFNEYEEYPEAIDD